MDTTRFMEQLACLPDDVGDGFTDLTISEIYQAYLKGTCIYGLVESIDIENECFNVKLGKNVYGILYFDDAYIQDTIVMTFNLATGQKVPGHYANSLVGTKVKVEVALISNDQILLTRKPLLTKALTSILDYVDHNGKIFFCRVLSFSKKSVFVDIGGGILGNIPISALSWVHYTYIERWVRKGDQFFANLVSVRPSMDFSLSRKSFYSGNDNPLDYKVRDIIPVQVAHSVPKGDGYFVEITPGIAGIMDSQKRLAEGEIKLGVIHNILKSQSSPCGYKFRLYEY